MADISSSVREQVLLEDAFHTFVAKASFYPPETLRNVAAAFRGLNMAPDCTPEGAALWKAAIAYLESEAGR